MSRSRYIYRRITRKRSASNNGLQNKQSAQSFFDFSNENSFFSGHTHEVNRKGENEKDESVQKKDMVATSNALSPNISNQIKSSSGGMNMSKESRQFFEPKFQADFSEVKLFNDKQSHDLAASIKAKAFTYKTGIFFNQGQLNPDSLEGKKLLAHELTHVLQQDKSGKEIQKKDEKPKEEPCTAGTLDLDALTDATYKKGKGVAVQEKRSKSKGCDACDDDSCVSITGKLVVPYTVSTKVNLPPVPANLTPCQQKRVSTAINTTLSAHENQHVAAFRTFNGTPSLSINYQGCESGYSSYQEGLAEAEFQRRKTDADAKSAALDPFMITVDLCCKDKPKK